MPTTDRIAEAQLLLRRAARDLQRAVKLLAETVEPEYDELPPPAPAETPGEHAAAVAHWFDHVLDSDPGFRAFHADWQEQERRRRR